MGAPKRPGRPTPKSTNADVKGNAAPWDNPMGNVSVAPGGSHTKKGATGAYLGSSDMCEKGTGVDRIVS